MTELGLSTISTAYLDQGAHVCGFEPVALLINGEYRGVCYSTLGYSETAVVPNSPDIGLHARRWGLRSSRFLFVNSRVRFVCVVRVSPVCFSVLVAITVHLLP